MDKVVKPLEWRDNFGGNEPTLELDKLGFFADARTVFGTYRITYWDKEWKVRLDGTLLQILPSLADAKTFAYDEYSVLVGELYEDELSPSKRQAKVTPLAWEMRDVWYVHCPILNREFQVVEEEGRWWTTFGGFTTDWSTAEEAKAANDGWRADMIRSALED